MPITLCVLLWPVDGADDRLTAYEDTVLALLPAHGGEVLARVRRTDDSDGPLETQILRLPDEDAIQAYMKDPARVTLTAVRDAVVARTVISEVEQL